MEGRVGKAQPEQDPQGPTYLQSLPSYLEIRLKLKMTLSHRVCSNNHLY